MKIRHATLDPQRRPSAFTQQSSTIISFICTAPRLKKIEWPTIFVTPPAFLVLRKSTFVSRYVTHLLLSPQSFSPNFLTNNLRLFINTCVRYHLPVVYNAHTFATLISRPNCFFYALFLAIMFDHFRSYLARTAKGLIGISYTYVPPAFRLQGQVRDN